MENEDEEFLKTMRTYTWSASNVDIEATHEPPIRTYKVINTNTPSSYRYMDLSSVSTRDLLNECYRRRAIEKFSASSHVDEFMVYRDVSIMSYAYRDVEDRLWRSVLKDEQFSKQAIKILDIGSPSRAVASNVLSTREILGEVYVCKHPESFKK